MLEALLEPNSTNDSDVRTPEAILEEEDRLTIEKCKFLFKLD